jgi:hypothetical protein
VFATGKLKVRSKPDLNLAVIGTQASGTQATIVGDPVSADNLIWWNVDYDSGVDGWSIEDGKFQRTECIGINAVLSGWARTKMSDSELLAKGVECFEGLYRQLEK